MTKKKGMAWYLHSNCNTYKIEKRRTKKNIKRKALNPKQKKTINKITKQCKEDSENRPSCLRSIYYSHVEFILYY